jgi:membrane dipeptidase
LTTRIFDMHADIPWDIVNSSKQTTGSKKVRSGVLESRRYPKLAKGGVRGFNAIIWVESEFKPSRALARGLEIVDSVFEDLRNSPRFKISTTSKDFRRFFESNERIPMILGTGGAELIEDNLAYLRTFYRLGVRSFGFVWNERNLAADGYGEINRQHGGSGLSEFGLRVVDECNRLGIIVDAAQITPNGLSDMLEYSNDPIIVSHGSTSIHPGTLRPMSDEHLRRIAKNNGVIGIFAINLNNTIPTLDSYIDHIVHAVAIAGVDHVGLGFDFVDYIPEGSLPPVKVTSVSGLEDHRFAQNVIKSLKQRGLKSTDIEKIASENFLRVFEEVCG